MHWLSAYPGRWLVAASFVFAALAAAVVVLWLALGADAICDFGLASSVFGTADWNWFPPGTTCTWTLGGVEHVDSPEWSRFAVLAVALGGVPLGLYLRRLLRAAHGADDSSR